MPTGAAQFLFVLVGCYTASKIRSVRVIIIIILTIVSAIGVMMMYVLDNIYRNAKLGGFYLALIVAAD